MLAAEVTLAEGAVSDNELSYAFTPGKRTARLRGRHCWVECGAVVVLFQDLSSITMLLLHKQKMAGS